MSIYWHSSRFLKHHQHILSTQCLIILITDVICIRMCKETIDSNMFLNLIKQIREIGRYLCWLYYLSSIFCTRTVWGFLFHLWLTPSKLICLKHIVFLYCFSSYGVLCTQCFSWLSIFDWPFGIFQHLFRARSFGSSLIMLYQCLS